MKAGWIISPHTDIKEDMTRKSRELRLSQTRKLIEAYNSAGLGGDRNCRFAEDMLHRLEHSRGLSPKRRSWLDSIIETGVPAPKGDPELLNRVEAAAAVNGMKDFDVKVLQEFAGKIRRGWELSQKQRTWLADLMSKAENLDINGPWLPDDITIEKLKQCVKLEKSYSTVYWQTHVGTYKALENVKNFLAGLVHADKWCVNKLLKSMARPLRQLETPKFKPGEIRWLHVPGAGYLSALIAEGPFISDETGSIVYSALVGGELIETAHLVKVRRK